MKTQKSRRQKKVESLLKDILSGLILEAVQDSHSSLISITRIEIGKDLLTAHIYVSVFDKSKQKEIIEFLNSKQNFFRKAVASRTKLKYNPMLIFKVDPLQEYDDRVQKILNKLDSNE
ncbi:MAG: 30S ribosome-binding factor RbfA [Candidatus Aminicenantes bacterium]|nr:30S ribosome-binding factor RbfA [Candidatus Aminicenantes bacterium]